MKEVMDNNQDILSLFQLAYGLTEQWYTPLKRHEKVLIPIKEEEYSLKCDYVARDTIEIYFRIEDYKASLLKDKRKGPKDNDLTILSGSCIYQLEFKNTKKVGHSSANAQLESGRKWLEHILWVCNTEKCLTSRRVYNIAVGIKDNKRSSLSRTNNLRIADIDNRCNHITTIWHRGNPKEHLQLDRLIKRVNNEYRQYYDGYIPAKE